MWGLAVGMVGVGCCNQVGIISRWHTINLPVRQGCSLPHAKLFDSWGAVFTPANEKSTLVVWIKFYYQELKGVERGSSF
jgi:hypothetical protein